MVPVNLGPHYGVVGLLKGCRLYVVPLMTTANSSDNAIFWGELITRVETCKVVLIHVGASLIVLEMVCAEAAELISKTLRIPTIGIGAGRS